MGRCRVPPLPGLPAHSARRAGGRSRGGDPSSRAAAGAELLATVTTDPSAEVIRLSPLTIAAVSQLLEAKLDATPDPAVVETCRCAVTQGTPFLVRELVEAVSEGGIGSAMQSVGRSVGLRLQRLPEHAGRLARALAVLRAKRPSPSSATRCISRSTARAAEAADLLAAAGIVEPGRPLTFVHPLVRDGIYSELSRAERAQGHRRAAELLAEQAGAWELFRRVYCVPPALGCSMKTTENRLATKRHKKHIRGIVVVFISLMCFLCLFVANPLRYRTGQLANHLGRRLQRNSGKHVAKQSSWMHVPTAMAGLWRART